MSLKVKRITHCACGSEIRVIRERGPRDTCRTCQCKDKLARWKERHPGRKNELERARMRRNRLAGKPRIDDWQNRNREVASAKSRRWRNKNRFSINARRRAYYFEHHDAEIQKVVTRQKLMRMPNWVNAEAVAQVYLRARQMTKETGVDHHVDHVIPLRGRTVCGLHVETILQILTADQNKRKGTRFESEQLRSIP